MLPIRFTNRWKHFAPLELQLPIRCRIYKHPAPPELVRRLVPAISRCVSVVDAF